MDKDEREKIENFVLLTHDLKTNLTASKWLLGMLENGDFGILTQTQRDALRKIDQANDRMLSSIRETLFLFRMGITDQVYRFSPCDINLIITDTLEQLQGELLKKNIVVEYTTPSEALIIQADLEKMRIVFQNIIDNAIKYGDIESVITISLSKNDSLLTCIITNKGIGIPEIEKAHIFEQYFRASNSKSHESGTGVGLFGTKQIIEKHNGTIHFESIQNKKTSFTITLPLEQHDKN
jgi:signal transduction histidine kinase